MLRHSSIVLALALSCAEPVPAAAEAPFVQEYSAAYTTEQGLPGNEAYAVACLADGRVFAGTERGLAAWRDGQWGMVAGFDAMPVQHLANLDANRLLLIYNGQLVNQEGHVLAPLPAGVQSASEVLCLEAFPGAVFLGTTRGLYALAGNRFLPRPQLNNLLGRRPRVCDITRSAKGVLAAATPEGLFLCEDGLNWFQAFPADGQRRWAPTDVRAVAFDGEERLWFASPQGAGRMEAGQWRLYSGADGLPCNDFTGIAASRDAVWFGTHQGAIRFDGKEWRYREGRRWLPDNDVLDIAVAPDGSAWFATRAGVGRIGFRAMTLADKARFFEDEIDARHRRTPYGYVLAVQLERPGDKSSWVQHDDDNDGQWTGMYGAAECFAYAATRDPKAKERATAAFEALRFLSQVTQGGSHPAPRGFPARTIRSTGDPDPNEFPEYSVAADERRRDTEDPQWKVVHPRWPVSEDGNWYWKCDTSSDELDGHYFLNACYYDLVAETEEEKERVRAVVRDMTDHLLEHGLRLVDWDGQPTRWANFSPESLNHDPSWWEERGLNSLSILAYLRAAAHITGDAKYDDAADGLIRNHSYATNTMFPKVQRGPGSNVQFDDEMAFMNFYHLLRYEQDPRLRAMFAYSCFRYWQLEACERNAFYNMAFAACCDGEEFPAPSTPEKVAVPKQCLPDALETLRRYPLDLVNWRHTNSRRLDILPLSPLAREPGGTLGKGFRIDGVVLPVDERYMKQWSDDPWELNSGGDGRELATGSAFLLAYYMGLYHEFIDK